MTPYDEANTQIHSDDPDQVRDGLERLRQRAEANPDDAAAWFHYGGALDYSDHEAEAMTAYERVFALGVDRLDPADQPRIYVQAGSTLRNLERLDEARSLLLEGRARFPDVRVLAVFLALVEVSARRDRTAIDLLLEVIQSESSGDESVGWFKRALAYYADEIRSG